MVLYNAARTEEAFLFVKVTDCTKKKDFFCVWGAGPRFFDIAFQFENLV